MAGETIFSCSVLPNQLEGAYGTVLKSLKEVLKRKGIEAERLYSISDIVLEYLVNIDLHPKMKDPIPESHISVLEDAGDIVVKMQGPVSSKEDMKRLDDLVRRYQGQDEDWLWSEREKISRGGRPFKTDGSGIGILTVAALSRDAAISCDKGFRSGTPYFTLMSRV